MTRQDIGNIIQGITSLLVASGLVWLTLQEVHTGWCKELPLMLYMLPAIGGMALLTVISRAHIGKWYWIDKAVLVWFAYITFNYWFVSPYPAGERYFMYLSSLLLYIFLRYTMTRHSRYTLLVALSAGGIYEAVLGAMQLMGMEYSRHSLFDVTGTFFNPGPYSAYLVVVLAIATAYIYKRRGLYCYPYFKRAIPIRNILPTCIYLACCITLYATAIILPATWSRSAFVAYFAVLLVLLYRKHKRWMLWLVCGSLLAGTLLYFVKQDSANGRVLMNTVSGRAIVETPWVGHGIGGFAHAFAESQAAYFKMYPESPFIEVAGSPEYAFNELLQIGVEQGCLGMLCFVVIAIGALVVLLRRRCELAYGWLALLVFAFFSYPFSLQPFRIMAVVFVAYAASMTSGERGNSTMRARFPHIVVVVLSMVTVCMMLPRVKQKVKATSDWEMISGYRSAAFADEYAEWYMTLNDNPKFLFAYGKMLHEMKRYNDSNAVLHDGIKVNSDPMFHVVIGNNYKALGAYKEAEEHYTRAFLQGPNKMYPLYQLLQLYIEVNEIVKAQEMAQRIVDFNPKIRSSATDEMKEFAKEYITNKQ